jgi:hypothetical protein
MISHILGIRAVIDNEEEVNDVTQLRRYSVGGPWRRVIRTFQRLTEQNLLG